MLAAWCWSAYLLSKMDAGHTLQALFTLRQEFAAYCFEVMTVLVHPDALTPGLTSHWLYMLRQFQLVVTQVTSILSMTR